MPPKKKKKARQSAPASSSSSSPIVKQVKSNVVTPSKQGNKKKIQLIPSDNRKGSVTPSNEMLKKLKPTTPAKRKQDSDDETESEIEEGEVILLGDKRAPPSLSKSSNVAGSSSQRAVSAPQALPSKPSLISSQERLPKGSAPVATAAALPPPAWNDNEKKEAMRLIKDITSLGLKPLQLVEAGIRQDIVIACCRELNISMNGGPVHPEPRDRLHVDEHPLITSQIARSPSPPFSSSIKIKSENEYKTPSSSPAGLPAKPVWTESISLDHSQVNPKLLSKKARKAIQKRADPVQPFSLSRTPEKDMSVDPMSFVRKASCSDVKLEDETAPLEVRKPLLKEAKTKAEGMNPMEKMRLAALASMKRKKAAASIATAKINSNGNESASVHQDFADAASLTPPLADDSVSLSDTIMTMENALPPDVPKGPRLGKHVYHDVDAPQTQKIDLEEEGDMMGASSSSRFSDADPRQARRSNLSYANDYAWDSDAPSGDVDLEAPLPSLQVKSINIDQSRLTHPLPSRPVRRRPLAADLMDMSGTSTPEYHPRPRPFLVNGIHTQRLVLECSDDEEEEEDENGKARQASTAFISQIYKQLNGSEDDLGSSSRSGLNVPTPPNGSTARRVSPSSSNADLSRKEQEIREMMLKIQEIEKKRGQAPSDPKVLAEVVKATVEGGVDSEKDKLLDLPTAISTASNGNNAPASSVPLYESPFSRYPSLRQVLQKDQ